MFLTGAAALKFVARVVVVVFTFTNILFAHKPACQEIDPKVIELRAGRPATSIWSDRKKSYEVASLPLSVSAAPVFGLSAVSAPLSSISSSLKKIPFVSEKQIPASFFSFVQLRETYKGAPGSTVVLIEDVHQNVEAQKNIAGALASLDSNPVSGSIRVGMEAATGPFLYDTYKNLPHQELAATVARSFFKSGQISGPAFAGFTTPNKKLNFWGVDDPYLYQANVAAYKNSSSRKSQDLKALHQWTLEIEKEKGTKFPSELTAFDRMVQAHRSGTLPLADYVEQLALRNDSTSIHFESFVQAMRMEKSIDLARVEAERKFALEKLVGVISEAETAQLVETSMAVKSGTMTFGDYYREFSALCSKKKIDLSKLPTLQQYIRYVMLADSIKAANVFKEADELERTIYNRLAETPAQKKLVNVSRQLFLARELINFTLTTDQWELYQRGRSLLENRLALSTYESFYGAAIGRNTAMILNLLENNKGSTSVLIAGGFHSKGLSEILKKINVSHVIVSPKITKIDTTSDVHYLSVFDREKSPLERLFAGQKLFLGDVPAGVVHPLRSDAPNPSQTILFSYLARGMIEYGVEKFKNEPLIQEALKKFNLDLHDIQWNEKDKELTFKIRNRDGVVLKAVLVPSKDVGSENSWDIKKPFEVDFDDGASLNVFTAKNAVLVVVATLMGTAAIQVAVAHRMTGFVLIAGLVALFYFVSSGLSVVSGRTPLIVGNWRGYEEELSEASKLIQAIMDLGIPDNRDVVIAPPFPYLSLANYLTRKSDLQLGAQNVGHQVQSAYTGETSPRMLSRVGVSYALVGHSERRHLLSEDERTINRKVHAVLGEGLTPILCINESLIERSDGRGPRALQNQLSNGLKDISEGKITSVVIAYEPVWIIGTGREITFDEIQEVHSFIRSWLSKNYSRDIAQSIRIIYGGSVKPVNADGILNLPDVDGVLVGGASLDADAFSRIVHFKSRIKPAIVKSNNVPVTVEVKKVPESDLLTKILFGTAGWRVGYLIPGQQGTAPSTINTEFTEGNLSRLAQAIAMWFSRTKPNTRPLRVAVGYDARPFARDFAIRIVEVLAANDIHADLIDQVAPTPVMAEATRADGSYALAIQVTASHNPVYSNLNPDVAWLGVKILENGLPAGDKMTSEIAAIANNPELNKEYMWMPFDKVGLPRTVADDQNGVYEWTELGYTGMGPDLNALSRVRISSAFDFKNRKEKAVAYKKANPNFGVYLTSMHGATSEPAEVLYDLGVVEEHLGKTPISKANLPKTVNNPKTGKQVIWAPDPTIEAFFPEFAAKMKPGKLGILMDGDGDRAVVIDTDGKTIISPNQLGLLFAHYLSSKGVKGPIVRTITTSRSLDRLARKLKVSLIQTAVGSKNFAPFADEKNPNSGIGHVEDSGHIFFKYDGQIFADSAVAEAALIIEILTETGYKSLTDYLRVVEQEIGGALIYQKGTLDSALVTPELKEKLKALRADHPRLFAETMARELGKKLKANTSGNIWEETSYDSKTDSSGILVNFDDDTWVMFRLSGTDGSVRLYGEETTVEKAANLEKVQAKVLETITLPEKPSALGNPMLLLGLTQLDNSLTSLFIAIVIVAFYMYSMNVAPATDSASSTPGKRKLRVLYLEDEREFREPVEKTLKDAGYEVVAVDDGTAGLKVLHDDPVPFDLILTDVVMPIMSGIQFYQLLEPHLKDRVLFITRVNEAVMRAKGIPESNPVLKKDVSDKDLDKALRAKWEKSQSKQGNSGNLVLGIAPIVLLTLIGSKLGLAVGLVLLVFMIFLLIRANNVVPFTQPLYTTFNPPDIFLPFKTKPDADGIQHLLMLLKEELTGDLIFYNRADRARLEVQADSIYTVSSPNVVEVKMFSKDPSLWSVTGTAVLSIEQNGLSIYFHSQKPYLTDPIAYGLRNSLGGTDFFEMTETTNRGWMGFRVSYNEKKERKVVEIGEEIKKAMRPVIFPTSEFIDTKVWPLVESFGLALLTAGLPTLLAGSFVIRFVSPVNPIALLLMTFLIAVLLIAILGSLIAVEGFSKAHKSRRSFVRNFSETSHTLGFISYLTGWGATGLAFALVPNLVPLWLFVVIPTLGYGLGHVIPHYHYIHSKRSNSNLIPELVQESVLVNQLASRAVIQPSATEKRLSEKLNDIAPKGLMIGNVFGSDFRRDSVNSFARYVNKLPSQENRFEALAGYFVYRHFRNLSFGGGFAATLEHNSEEHLGVAVFHLNQLGDEKILKAELAELTTLAYRYRFEQKLGHQRSVVIAVSGELPEAAVQKLKNLIAELDADSWIAIVRVTDDLRADDGDAYSYEKLLKQSLWEGNEKKLFAVQKLLEQNYDVANFVTYSKIPTQFIADGGLRSIWTLFANIGSGWTLIPIETLLKTAAQAKQHA